MPFFKQNTAPSPERSTASWIDAPGATGIAPAGQGLSVTPGSAAMAGGRATNDSSASIRTRTAAAASECTIQGLEPIGSFPPVLLAAGVGMIVLSPSRYRILTPPHTRTLAI